MTAPAAISGTFADLRTVKSRSVLQLVIEVPIERGADVVSAFGFPQPGASIHVAVARLAETKPAETKSRKSWSELSPAQQAGIRCSELAFQRFLSEVGEADVQNEQQAANYVRLACGVTSRSDLKGKAAQLWADLEARYQAWMQGT